MTKLSMFERVNHVDGKEVMTERSWWFWCPGCETHHRFTTDKPNGERPNWRFSGTIENPTFSPSLLINQHHPASRCHLYLEDGHLRFLGDCFHALAGKKVPLPEDPDPFVNPKWSA